MLEQVVQNQASKARRFWFPEFVPLVHTDNATELPRSIDLSTFSITGKIHVQELPCPEAMERRRSCSVK